MRDTVKDIKFGILDKNFNLLVYLDHYEEIMWIDKYDEIGELEVNAHPTSEIMEAAQIDNYVWSSISEHLMIIDSISFKFDSELGIRYIIKAHSLEVILRRRVLTYKTVFRNNLEDSIRQIIDWGFMRVTESGRKINNFRFQYSNDRRINTKTIDYEYEPGTELITVIQEMCQAENIGFKITVDSSNYFVFQLYVGEDRSYEQNSNPWIVFSPKYNNLISDKLEQNAFDYKNFVFVVGEEYEEQDAEWIRKGTGQTGLYRREMYESAADINHEVEDINLNKTILTAAQYTAQLNQRANNKLKEFAIQKEIESEVDPNVNFEYDKDYFIGDIVQLENGYGYDERVRVSEFIIDHDLNGLAMYPTFKTIVE